MNIKKYEAFVRAVELGSLSKASEELGYTQSGISHMMQSLEEEVGFSLMVRTSSGIVPNNEGELLLPIIRQLLNTNESLEQYIAKIKGADTGRIRIAAFPSLAVYWLPRIIRRFQQDYPDVQVQVLENCAGQINQMMANREADLCLYGDGTEQPFEWFPLLEDRMMALVPPGHPLTNMEAVPVEALAAEPFIMPVEGYEYEIHHILDQMEHPPCIRFSACSDYAVISMVAEGLGVGILPELILRNYPNDAVAIPIEPARYRVLGMGVPQVKTASPVTRNFMRYIQAYVKGTQRENG